MTLALIDADVVAFRCAASAIGAPEDIAIMRADIMMRELLDKVGAPEYRAWLTGDNNFRKVIYPEYKANRKDKPKPEHLNACREYLCREWGAFVTDGYEADDALGIHASDRTVICSNDKDLLQIPGKHFNIVKSEFLDVEPVVGLRNFYHQLLLGDRSDNIPGYDGVARVKPTIQLDKWLTELHRLQTEEDMYEFVCDRYELSQEQLELHAQLLYIWRKENDKWVPPSQRAVEIQ